MGVLVYWRRLKRRFAPNFGPVKYDQRKISYAGSVDGAFNRALVRTIEWLTGKRAMLLRFRRFERFGMPRGHRFWRNAFRLSRIRLETPPEQMALIPKTGPLVVIANHPFGLIDGMVLCNVIGAVRRDYKILSRWFLAELEEVEELLIPVSFKHDEDSLKKNLEMRKQCMGHLKDGGVIMLFPAGTVAVSEDPFGEVVEKDWNPFTAKMIRRSGATVLPVYFPGQNPRSFQLASLISPILRQSLMINAVVNFFDRPQKPVIGKPITPDQLKNFSTDATMFVKELRDLTLALKNKKPENM